ncbi:hypothetical protein LJB63_26595, partial [[Eubacterium] rectale]|nr:hypothetical protein [Agathobacter rectalis]
LVKEDCALSSHGAHSGPKPIIASMTGLLKEHFRCTGSGASSPGMAMDSSATSPDEQELQVLTMFKF